MVFALFNDVVHDCVFEESQDFASSFELAFWEFAFPLQLEFVRAWDVVEEVFLSLSLSQCLFKDALISFAQLGVLHGNFVERFLTKGVVGGVDKEAS